MRIHFLQIMRIHFISTASDFNCLKKDTTVDVVEDISPVDFCKISKKSAFYATSMKIATNVV